MSRKLAQPETKDPGPSSALRPLHTGRSVSEKSRAEDSKQWRAKPRLPQHTGSWPGSSLSTGLTRAHRRGLRNPRRTHSLDRSKLLAPEETCWKELTDPKLFCCCLLVCFQSSPGKPTSGVCKGQVPVTCHALWWQSTRTSTLL